MLRFVVALYMLTYPYLSLYLAVVVVEGRTGALVPGGADLSFIYRHSSNKEIKRTRRQGDKGMLKVTLVFSSFDFS